MSASIEKIKDRVRKLFNLAANDAAAEGEVANALKAARELMAANQLSEDDVAAEPEDLRTPEQIARDTEYGTGKSWSGVGRAPTWQGTLAVAVADFVATVGVYRDHPTVHRDANGFVKADGNAVTGWVFYGPAEDVELARELHEELLFTCATAAKLKFGGDLMRGTSRDYCDGFASGLYQKVQDARKAEKEEVRQLKYTFTPGQSEGEKGRALSVVRAGDITLAKHEQGRKWLEREKGVKLGRSGGGRGRSIGDRAAYSAGKADGRSQGLSKQRMAKIGSR